MVTEEPVNLDGCWATFGCPGSGAIRGSSLPGSTWPGRLGRLGRLGVQPVRLDVRPVGVGLAVGAAAFALGVGLAEGLALGSSRPPPVKRSPIPRRMSPSTPPSRVGVGDGLALADGVAVGALR
ncbi:hypothetical protein AB0F73_29385, partial [Micromonospora purpureochromogenes]|uniref:hypothetical protein n=1 Tax=Micromonospora purpureochromogenes TaxID=47872 RepID=UPI0033C84C8C